MEKKQTNPANQPDLVDLRAFCLVVDLGSLTEAARLMKETKGSISRRLSRLEEILGVSLLQRSPRLVQATEEGRLYRQQIGQVIELLDSANAAVQHTQEAPRGLLRITAPYDIGVTLLAPIVADFIEKYPGVTIDVVLTSQLLDFDEHQIDFALRATSNLKDSSLIAHRLSDIKIILVASPAYLRRTKPITSPNELSEHNIMANRSVTLLLCHTKSKETHSINTGAITAEMYFLARVACAGAGIAAIPAEIIREELADRTLQRVLPEYEVLPNGKLYLLQRSWQFLPPKIRAFRDFILQRFSESEGKR